jgi:hypothetical protein
VRRRTFDLIASLGGLALAVVLLVLGIPFQQEVLPHRPVQVGPVVQRVQR